ncbi:hypothetical protein SAMN05444166_5368 [Singulisphaera sp. GP187]|uniref:hypothetical protein n=1 Tax=Singulisphaera sp. GP187 TaxID=1882752 RepID=UPI000928EB18|nr:hypothetical protein [Singulisphaera sp. GP187]SIO57250.1 hypothetical protein SAMN05444166_5368 [Singulisphaera sp. GP187]
MGVQGRKPPSRPGFLQWVALIAASMAASGCLGPAAIRSTRMRYNEVVRATNDEQLLMNLVRLRYADSPIFIDLPNITSQFEVAGGTTYPGPGGAQTNFGIVGLSGHDTPTLSYHPRQGRAVAKSLLNPLSTDLFSVVNAGARVDQLFWMTLNDINDVPNAFRATTLVPKVPDENSLFLRGVQLLEAIDDQGGVELGYSTSESDDTASGPIPEGLVQGSDLLGAAKDGYAFRTNQDGRLALYKREKDLILKVRPRFTHSPEMEELAQIFHLTPGLSHYKIKSELQPNAERSPLGTYGAGDTIYLNLRSILQVMTFLSKGVCVPEEHVRDGEAPTTPGPDGRPFNWTGVTTGNFFVASQKHRPHDAEVAVHYRGYWFFIPRDDVTSRSVLAVLEIILSLQESDEKTAGPVLTLPIGG